MCSAVTSSLNAFIHGQAALEVSSGGNEGRLMIYGYANVFKAAVVCLFWSVLYCFFACICINMCVCVTFQTF